MELERQVSNQELSKILSELGFKQESLFYWVIEEDRKKSNNIYTPWICQSYEIGRHNTESQRTIFKKLYSAYTVAELGEMLPTTMGFSILETFRKKVNCNKHHWKCCYRHLETGEEIDMFKAETEADARAKMLIYLKEHNLI